MKRIAASLLAVGLLAAPVLAAETAPPATAPAAATKAADATPKASYGAKGAPTKTEPKNVATAKKHARRHKRHATVTKPKAAPAPATKS